MYSTPNLKPHALTYQKLVDHHQAKYGGTSNWANMLSAMNRFLSAIGKFFDSPIGSEMEECFADALEKALNDLSHPGAVRSRLKKWQESYIELLERLGMPKHFGDALKWGIDRAGSNVNKLGTSVGIDPKVISAWVKGTSSPNLNRTETRSIIKIERELNVPENSLLSKIAEYYPVRLYRNNETTSYGEILAKRKVYQNCYGLTHVKQWPEQLRTFWGELFHYKTVEILLPGIRRHKKAGWPLKTNGKRPAAEAVQACFGRMLGFYSLPPNDTNPMLSGLGIPFDQLCPSMLFAPEHVVAFLEFSRMRVGSSTYSGSAELTIAHATTLCHPETGFLTQRRDLILRENQKESEVSWLSFCAKSHKFLREACRNLEIKKNRDPHKHLVRILDEQQPIKVLWEAHEAGIVWHEKKWGARLTIHAARSYRDCLLHTMFMLHPLRCKNMTYLTWSEDNTGHLYKKEGAWRFDIPPEEFKNEIGAAEHGYRMIVYKLLWPMIDRYLNDYRPLLRRPDSNRFFLSARGLKNDGLIGVKSVHKAIKQYTRCFCPIKVKGGLGPHSYRHIVVTDILKNDPTMIEVAAAVVQDRPETVRKAYARWLQGDKVAHFFSYLNKTYPGSG